MGYYYTARICNNGHLITDLEELRDCEGTFCPQCGAASIVACPNCSAPILGHYHVDGFLTTSSTFKMSRYCSGCGSPFPWTEKALDAATILINETEEIDKKDREALITSLPDLVVLSPYTPVAQSRMKRFLSKASVTIGDAVKEILVSVATETVKHHLGI